MNSIAFITCDRIPNLTADDRLVVEELREFGIAVTPVVWTDSPDLSGFELVVVRSPWDYHLKFDQFQDWLSAVEQNRIPLLNPAPIIKWNMNKQYLRELEARGVPVVPSVWIQRGNTGPLQAVLDAQQWDQVVVKPTVSATAYETHRVTKQQTGKFQAQFMELANQADLVVQPFLEEIQTAGEWSFIFVDGKLTHTVLKQAKAGDFRVQEEWGGQFFASTAPPAVVNAAHRVIEALDETLLYARVDGVVKDGTFWLMELELIEPALYFSCVPEAARRLAEAIACRVNV